MDKIIDFHCHVFPEKIAQKASEHLEKYYHIPMPAVGTLDVLEDNIKDTPIVSCVVHSTATKSAQVSNINDYIASVNSSRYLGFGTIHPHFEDIKGEVLRIKKLGLHGIKLHPDFQSFAIDSDEAMPIYEAAEDAGLPLLIHMGDEVRDESSPFRLANVLERFKKLTVIGAHMGGYSRWDEAVEYLYQKNVYFDTSSTMRIIGAERMKELIRLHGADKILFGTDFPMELHADCIGQIRSLGLSQEEEKKIFYENAKKLLKL